MTKIIAAINMTLDGYCDHTAVDPDEKVHDHYTALLNTADAILYGRKTYELMEYWKPFLKKPSGEKAMDAFATAIDKIQKIVFSHTLKSTDWKSATLSKQSPAEVISEFKQQTGKEVLVGSRSLILNLMELNLIDEYQICIHPVIVGKGLPLFEKIKERIVLKLLKTKSFDCGAIIHYYSRA